MESVFRYFGRHETIRTRWSGLPGWARNIVLLFALPGIVLCLLSILALLVSILALLLLTLPVYRLLKALTGAGSKAVESSSYEVTSVGPVDFGTAGPGVKRVEAKVIETREDPGPGL